MKAHLTALLGLAILIPTISPSEDAAPASFYNITDVITKWTPEQHLWIKGNLGVSKRQLNGLESWLDENGANWTVVLMETASGQRYETHSGMNAVEHALGKGLSNQTGFGSLTDKRTGESNGAVFVLFLQERKFSYFASDAFDNRGLGERYWIGRLDKPAINAMRNGGRIVDAVKNTVTSIESSLTRKVQEENERQRLAEIERQRAIDEAKLYATQLRSLIEEAAGRTTKLQQANPKLTGAVVRPDLVPWKAEAETIARLAEQGDYKNARKHFTDTQNAIEAYHGRLDNWESDKKRFAPLDEQIKDHPTSPNAPVVEGHLSRAEQALNSALSNHTIGDPLYSEQLASADRYLAYASDSYEQWLESERQRKSIIRGSIAVTILTIIVFLGVANRRRRRIKSRAEETHADWEDQLEGKFSQLFSLMDRTGLVVGSSEDLEKRNFEGTTLKLAKDAIHGVDELFIMSAATDKVMKEVKALIYPGGALNKTRNAFSKRSYREAVELLTSTPIGFDQHDHLEAILHPEGSQDAEAYTRTLLGESTDYEPFRISFEKLIKEYDQRQSQAFEDIARLEAGIDGLPLTQQQLQASLDQAANESSLLALESEEDSFFPMRSLQKTLIPAGQAALDEAAAVGQQDPVEAFESLIPEASRLVTEAGAMTATLQSFREIDLPEIERARSRLADHERLVGWIETALSDMSARCENLGSQGASVSIEEPWLAFDNELTLLKGRTLNSKQLTQRIHEELTPMVEQRSREIIEARSALARQLGIDEKSLLNEPNLRPDESLDDARNNITSALTAIDHGQATAARESLAEAERSLDDIVALISLSQTSAKDHATRLRELTEGHKTVSGEVAPAETLINELREQYAPSVTLFASRFGEGIDGQKSIAESIERANRRLDQTRLELSESATAFNAGELIRGFGLLETVANELDFARHQLALIRDQHAALKQTEKNNGELAVKLGDRHRELALLSEDRRTCQSTIDAHLSTGSALEEWRVALQAPRPDPFQLHRTGESLEHQLNAVEDGIDADWKAFKMAESASTGAKAALTFCHTFLREAREDNIPDSRALSRAIVRHEELTIDHAGIEQQLEIAHSDWSELFAQTAHITAETGKVRSTLQSELAAGREAAQQIERAAAQITKLNRWRSSYYVKPNRHAGGAALVRAKQALFKGDYARARKAAVASRGEAERELARAKLNESRKASATAAARRRAAQNSFSSGASFSSGSSFSSGFSSSSFSSGSGFSRSGW